MDPYIPQCSRCGYDLTGLSDTGQCPECGQAFRVRTGEGLAKVDSVQRRDNQMIDILQAWSLPGLGICVMILGWLLSYIANNPAKPLLFGMIVGGLLTVAGARAWLRWFGIMGPPGPRP